MPPKKRSAPTAEAPSPTQKEAPAASSVQEALDALTSLFPITSLFPDPTTDDTLIPTSDVMLEQELLRNPDNFRSWSSYIDHIIETNIVKRPPPDISLSAHQAALLGPLASSTQRTALRRITSIYERALVQFPTRYSLWRDYLQHRTRFVLGEPKGGFEVKRKRDLQAAREKLDFGPALIESPDDEDYGSNYRGGLDGTVGWPEWKSLGALYERALMWLPTMPRLWLSYLSIFLHPQCPPMLSYTHARRTFDRALRTLPGSLHLRIWKVYLKWAERRGGETCLRVWRRYLRVDASLTERYISILLAQTEDQQEDEEEEDNEDEDGEASQSTKQGPGSKALEASKLLLGLARGAMDGSYVSPEGKSPYQLFIEWLELTEQYPEEIGLDPEEEKQALKHEIAAPAASRTSAKGTASRPQSQGRGKGKAAAPESSKTASARSAETDPMDPTRLNVTAIIQSDGLDQFTDQSGRLWTGLATYWIKRGELEVARDTLEAGMKAVKTVRDFTQIFDAYAETCENVIAFMMDELAQEDGDEDDQEQTREEKEVELDRRMQEFEELIERRPFLVNDVLLRRNPDDVQEWEKRVALYGDQDEKIIETYTQAIQTINPRKATANLHQLYLNFAQFYEYGGSAGLAKLSREGNEAGEAQQEQEQEEVEGDLESARKIFEKAVTVPFRRVDDLAEIWCEWAEMELRHSNYDEAIRIMARSVAPPRNTKDVQYHDDTLAPQTRLFKSLKLWSFYVDLEESLGDVESTKRVYEKMLELKIANAQIIINYAAFLEDNRYFEESFKVYERGVELFTYPVAFEIWNVYLSKFVKRYGGAKLERARDLFEQALDKCPARFCKPLLLMYGQLEEEHGLAKRAMKIYDRATRAVATDDRFDMFVFYIAKAAANFGLAATRPIYERAIEALPDRQTAEMCLRFAELERKLGEIDRARAIYAHASQFCDPRTHTEFWKQWNQFEIETGSEDTFREMLRIKRSVQAQFNTDVSYIAASAVTSAQRSQNQTQAQSNGTGTAGAATIDGEDANDPMARVEAASRPATRQPAFVAATTAASGARAVADATNGDGGETKNTEVVGGDDEDDDDLL